MLSILREIAINCHLTEVRNKLKFNYILRRFLSLVQVFHLALFQFHMHKYTQTHTHAHTRRMSLLLLLQEIIKLLRWESAAEHHKQFDAFALFLLSHGERNKIYGRDEKTVSIDIITGLFDGKNCSHLINKPKLFFIQACQGGKNILHQFPIKVRSLGLLPLFENVYSATLTMHLTSVDGHFKAVPYSPIQKSIKIPINDKIIIKIESCLIIIIECMLYSK